MMRAMSFIQNAKAECIDFSSALILVCDVGSIPRRSRIMRQALWCLAERNLVEPTVSGHPPYILPADGESQSADQVPTKAIKKIIISLMEAALHRLYGVYGTQI